MMPEAYDLKLNGDILSFSWCGFKFEIDVSLKSETLKCLTAYTTFKVNPGPFAYAFIDRIEFPPDHPLWMFLSNYLEKQ